MSTSNSELKEAVGYCRFSSNMQREESIDAQKRAISQYCDLYGYKISQWYCDEAKSGTNDKRPAFQAMIADVKLGNVQNVIVHKLDRFSRNVRDSLDYISLLEENNVNFISVSENLSNSPSGKMITSILSVVSEFYIDNLSQEVMKGLKENAYNCMWTGGTAPLGYDVVDKKLVVNPKEAEAIKIIFEMCADGYGYGQIIDRLNLLGYKTKKGNKFGKNSLHDLIENERYKGTFIFNKRSRKKSNGKRNNHKTKKNDDIIRIPNGCPAIVSEELWNRANKTKIITSKYNTNAKREYLLTGFLFCEDCGSKMHGNIRYSPHGKKYQTYRCNAKSNSRCCSSKEIRAAYVDSLVLNEIFKAFFTDETIDKLVESINEHKKKILLDDEKYNKAVETQKMNIKTREILINALADTNNNASIIQKINEIEEEIKKAKNLIDSFENASNEPITKNQIKEMLDKFKKSLQNAGCIEQTKLLLSKMIEKIVIGEKRITLFLKLPIPQSKNSDIDINREPLIIVKATSRYDVEHRIPLYDNYSDSDGHIERFEIDVNSMRVGQTVSL